MLLIEPRKLVLAHINPSPVRLATRAALRVAEPSDAVDWRAVQKAADDFCARTAYVIPDGNRRRHAG